MAWFPSCRNPAVVTLTNFSIFHQSNQGFLKNFLCCDKSTGSEIFAAYSVGLNMTGFHNINYLVTWLHCTGRNAANNVYFSLYNSKNRVQQKYGAKLSHRQTDHMSYIIIIVSYPSDGIFFNI